VQRDHPDAKRGIAEEELFKQRVEAGAEDLEATENLYIVTTLPGELYAVKEAVSQLGSKCDEASLEMIPKTYVECDPETFEAK